MNPGSDFVDCIYKRNDDIVSRRIIGETILVPVTGKLADMQRIFTLNPVGEYIWDQLDGKQNLSQIIDGIGHAFEVEKEEAEKDARSFIEDLLREGLIGGEN
jgi:hypothetical protein